MSGIRKRCRDEVKLLASIQLSPLATVVTDVRLPDNPIIGVNVAFCELTGYSREDLIGCNCRILGGPQTEAEGKRVLSRAIAAGEPAITELTNYRKNGMPFRNAVMIAPIRSTSGVVTYFMGTQMLVHEGIETGRSRRMQAERLVEKLTERQLQVLMLMAAGLRSKAIGERLGIAMPTVKLHRSNLLRNLEAKSPGEAVRIALEAGLRAPRT